MGTAKENKNPPGKTSMPILRTTRTIGWLVTVSIIVTTTPVTAPAISKVPSWAMGQGENIWVQLAKEANTDTICLATNNVANPFSTCLVGVPLSKPMLDAYKNPPATNKPIVEFELLGSAITSSCFMFVPKPNALKDKLVDVTSKKGIYKNSALWCNGTTPTKIPVGPMVKPRELLPGDFMICGERAWNGIPANPTGGPCTIGKITLFHPYNLSIPGEIKSKIIQPGIRNRNKRQIMTSSVAEDIRRNKEKYPLAWDSFPHSPNSQLHQKTQSNTPKTQLQITNGSLTFPNSLTHLQLSNFQINFDNSKFPILQSSDTQEPATPTQSSWKNYLPVSQNCDPSVWLWPSSKDFWVSFFLAGIATDHALTTLSHMTCWMAKEANATSLTLQELLEDSLTLKGVSLHNRAAIDFLLVLHNHGCQEFTDLCCLNFSDHSKSIQANINTLHDLVSKLRQDPKWHTPDLFEGLKFPSLPNWARQLLLACISILISIVLVLCIMSCLVSILKKYCLPQVNPNVLEVRVKPPDYDTLHRQENKKGGDAEDAKRAEFHRWKETYDKY